MDITIGDIVIKQANDHGPDGHEPIMWSLIIGDKEIAKLRDQEIFKLSMALDVWLKVNKSRT